MMTVADLIVRLQELDPTLLVRRYDDGVLVDVNDAYVERRENRPDVVVIE